MSLENDVPTGDMDAAVDAVMEKLDLAQFDDAPEHDEHEDEGTEEAAEEVAEATEGDEPEVDGETVEEHAEGGADEPAEAPAIELPETFTPELKERFAKLPADLQQTLAQWESERNRGVNQKLQEAASTRKSADEALKALEPEKQRLATLAETALNLTRNADPALRDWFGLTAEQRNELLNADPIEFTRRRETAEQRVGQLRQIEAEQARINGERWNAHVETESKALVAKLPELTDATKRQAFGKAVGELLAQSGFSSDEIKGAVDHRMLTLADRLMKAEAKLAAADKARETAKGKAVRTAPKTLKPGTGESGKGGNQAIRNAARNARSTAELADILARTFE